MRKKIISLALALILCLGLAVPAMAVDTSGLDANGAKAFYDTLSAYGKKSGYVLCADLQDMNMVADETYDIIVCSHVLEHVENDAKAMGELYRMLKPDGVCLVLVPLIVGKQDTEEKWGCSIEENWRRFGQGDHSRLYGREDFIGRLQKAGFYVNELGKEWFGEEFYREYGFDELSVMYVATKAVRLV